MFGGALANSKNDRPAGSVNYGQMNFTVAYIAWVDGKRVPLTKEQYDSYPTPADRRIEVTIGVDTRAINPHGFEYFAKRVDAWQQDWNKIWVPSLEAVFGKTAVEADIEAVMGQLEGAWVAVEDVPQTPKKGELPQDVKYKTPKLVAVFPSKEECSAAYLKQYGAFTQPGAASTAQAPTQAPNPLMAMMPAGYQQADWTPVVEYARGRVAGGANAMQLATELSLTPDVAGKLYNLLATPAKALPF